MITTSSNLTEWAIYRTSDPAGLLKVRVTVHREKTSQDPPPEKPVEEKSQHSQNAEQPDNAAKPEGQEGQEQPEQQEEPQPKIEPVSNDYSIVREIQWRERIFSPLEVRNYKNGTPISNDAGTDSKYKKNIHDIIEEDPNFTGSEIFTYVDEDNYVDPSEEDVPFYGKVGERKPTDLAAARLKGTGPDAITDVARSNANSLHLFVSSQNPDGTFSQDLIGIIRVYPGGRIETRPPFSNKRQVPTTYKYFTQANEQVFYTFDVIETKPDESSLYETTLRADISQRRAQFTGAHADCPLANSPQEGWIRMFYYGEISFAKLFNDDSLYIYWNLKLPKDWVKEGDLPTSGISQLSVCNEDGIAHINLPIDLVALCPGPIAPLLCLTLYSRTSSNAEVVIGYGAAPLPMTTGSHEIRIDTWRPRGSLLDELRLQFLDSGLELQMTPGLQTLDPEAMLGTAENRFGLKTVGTGYVIAKFNLAMQSKLFKTDNQMQGISRPVSAANTAYSSRIQTLLSRQQE